MHSCIRYTLAISCTLFALTHITADDIRTWTDNTGQYTIEAKFIGLEGNKVILEKADGSRIQIELIKLKPEDRTEAMKANTRKMTENPFKNAGDNPFKNANTKPNNRNAKTSTEPDPNTPNATMVDWTAAKQLSVFGSDWKPPSIKLPENKLDWQPRPVSFSSKDFWDKPTGVVTSGKRAVIVSAQDKPSNTDASRSTIHYCDLEKGNVLKSFSATGKFTPLAMSLDGSLVIARQDVFGHDKSNILELWKVSDTEFTRLQRWEGAPSNTQHGKDVQGAAFLSDGKTFLTWINGGLLTWWNVSEVKPLQTLQLESNTFPSITSDLKYIVGRSTNDVVLLDALSGDTLSIKPMPQERHLRYAISPDGKQLAGLSTNKVEVFDMQTMQLVTTIAAHGFGHESACFWATPKALLAGHPLSYIVPDLNVNAWSYDGIEKMTVLGDHVLALFSGRGNSGSTLIPLKLPHPSAQQMIDQAKNDPNFFILKPGSTVRVDASKITDPGIQQEAIEALSAKLKQVGMSVGSGNLTLIATLEKSTDHEVAYHDFPRVGFGREKTHKVPGWTYQLKLVADGRTHWTTGAGNHPPPIIHLKKDETIEEHLKQYGLPSAEFFKNVELPKYVARAQTDQPGGSISLRRSQVTPNGIR